MDDKAKILAEFNFDKATDVAGLLNLFPGMDEFEVKQRFIETAEYLLNSIGDNVYIATGHFSLEKRDGLKLSFIPLDAWV